MKKGEKYVGAQTWCQTWRAKDLAGNFIYLGEFFFWDIDTYLLCYLYISPTATQKKPKTKCATQIKCKLSLPESSLHHICLLLFPLSKTFFFCANKARLKLLKLSIPIFFLNLFFFFFFAWYIYLLFSSKSSRMLCWIL